MTIHISATQPHSGNDLKIVATNTITNETVHGFIHKKSHTLNTFAVDSIGQTFPEVYEGDLRSCVEYLLGKLKDRLPTPPSNSQRIYDEARRQSIARMDLIWLPAFAK